jgi:hypothetical protein
LRGLHFTKRLQRCAKAGEGYRQALTRQGDAGAWQPFRVAQIIAQHQLCGRLVDVWRAGFPAPVSMFFSRHVMRSNRMRGA